MQREYWDWNCHHGKQTATATRFGAKRFLTKCPRNPWNDYFVYTIILLLLISKSMAQGEEGGRVPSGAKSLHTESSICIHPPSPHPPPPHPPPPPPQVWHKTDKVERVAEHKLARLLARTLPSHSTIFLKCISRVYSSSVFLYFSSVLSSVFLNLSYCCIYNSKENWLGSHSFITLHHAFIKCIFQA